MNWETLKKKFLQTEESEREDNFDKVTPQTRLQEHGPKQPIDKSLYTRKEQEEDIL